MIKNNASYLTHDHFWYPVYEYALTSQKSTSGSVSHKEHISCSLRVYHAKSMKYALSMGVKNIYYYFRFLKVDGLNCFCPLFLQGNSQMLKIARFQMQIFLVTVPRKVMNQRINKIINVEL